MSGYAKGTTVPIGKTISEIQRQLERSGASAFGYMSDSEKAAIGFARNGIRYQVMLLLPDRNSTQFTTTPMRMTRSESAAQALYEAEARRKWRALGMVIKAKLVAVEEGVVEFESEFLAHAILTDGRTMFEHARPALAAAQSGQGLTLALPGGNPC